VPVTLLVEILPYFIKLELLSIAWGPANKTTPEPEEFSPFYNTLILRSYGRAW